MSALDLAAFINVDDASKPISLAKAHPREAPHPTLFELDQMNIGSGAHYSGPGSSKSGHDAPKTPNELESRPPSPSIDAVASLYQTWNSPSINKWRLLACCLINFCNGFNDSAPGALLPYMEKYFSVGYAIVSIIFIANAAGFLCSSFYINALDQKIGRGKTLMVAEFLCVLGYILMAATPPFPGLAVAFFMTGLGMATGLSLNNVFCAQLGPSTYSLGIFHGSYGLGGLVAPIIATSMVTHGVLFSRFYIILLILRILTFIFSGWSFYHYERDTTPPPTLLAHTAASPEAKKTLGAALKQRTTLMGAIFIFAYQGAEVSISGWVISFLIHYRHTAPSRVGYVTAGFWGGITLGRFLLTPVSHRIGEKTSTYGLIALAAVFQLLVWLVPNVIAESVSIALLGLILGPIYPCATVVLTQLLERRLQTTALGFISSAGSSGGAVAPFVIGLGAQAKGVWVLHPVCVALFAVMAICWVGLPRVSKRRE